MPPIEMKSTENIDSFKRVIKCGKLITSVSLDTPEWKHDIIIRIKQCPNPNMDTPAMELKLRRCYLRLFLTDLDCKEIWKSHIGAQIDANDKNSFSL